MFLQQSFHGIGGWFSIPSCKPEHSQVSLFAEHLVLMGFLHSDQSDNLHELLSFLGKHIWKLRPVVVLQ